VTNTNRFNRKIVRWHKERQRRQVSFASKERAITVLGNEVANRREQGIRTSEKTSWEEQSKSSEVAVTSTVKFPPCIFRPERRCNNLPRRKICQLVARETASAMHASRHLLVGRCYNFVLFADGVVVVSRSETRNLRTVLCDEFIRESNKNSTYKSLFHFYYR